MLKRLLTEGIYQRLVELGDRAAWSVRADMVPELRQQTDHQAHPRHYSSEASHCITFSLLVYAPELIRAIAEPTSVSHCACTK